MTIPIDYLWSQVLERLQLVLSRPTFETWIKTANVERLENNCLVIRSSDPFARNWLQKYYLKTITHVVQDILGHPVKIYITTPQEENVYQLNEQETKLEVRPQNFIYEIAPNQLTTNIKLNPKYIFSQFTVGANNRIAYVAALAVAESPGTEFNPFFLCGGVGLGKTHLIQAIGNYSLENHPNKKIIYVSTEQFTSELITAIRQDSMQSFRQHYRDIDLLLLDDIQFIEGKEYTQEEFFHTFNSLYEDGKQVVLACDRPPSQITRLQERLYSRFSMGLIADIKPPNLEERIVIIQKKAESKNINLPMDIIEYIASKYTSDIREMEGALIRALTYISISGLSITIENVAPVLAEILNIHESE